MRVHAGAGALATYSQLGKNAQDDEETMPGRVHAQDGQEKPHGHQHRAQYLQGNNATKTYTCERGESAA